MADEPAGTPAPAPSPAPAGPPAGPPPAADTSGVRDVGGGVLRTTPTTEEAGKTVEEEAAEQALANETPEEKASREAAEATAKDAPTDGETKAPEGVDFKGTIFDGTSPELQAKVAPYAAAYAENGTLTDAEVTEAAKATGFSEAAVRQFMAGASAEVAVAGKPVFELAGGEQQFNEFRAWTAQEGNLTSREEATINKAIKAGDMETATELMRAPMERWKAAGGGAAPRDVTQGGAGGDGGAGQAGDVYGSWAAVEKDMGKPEYRNDPAFRDKVTQKLARSPLG